MKTKTAIYAGSFDPWSFGHQFVLESALEIFDTVHVLVAINPAKKETLDPLIRVQIIAHCINPFQNWLESKSPLELKYSSSKIHVTFTTGLVADYAKENNITHLIRGLRSTSDFESEFNLYFSNHAIFSDIQTWAIMCPPHLLHCSSTYVRSVVGQKAVKYVGTTFLAQSFMLRSPPIVGRLLDMIQCASQGRFISEPADLNIDDLNSALQKIYNKTLLCPNLKISQNTKHMNDSLDAFLSVHSSLIQNIFQLHSFSSKLAPGLWAILLEGTISAANKNNRMNEVSNALLNYKIEMGRTGISLINDAEVKKIMVTK